MSKNGSFCPTFLAPITTQMEEKCLIYSYIWSRKYTKYIKYKKKRKSKIPPFFHSGSKLLIVWGLAPPCTIINLLRIGARMGIPPPPRIILYFSRIEFQAIAALCLEVLCLGSVTFEQGVAWLTVSYSMAVRPIEEHPCALRGKGTQIKYASRWLRALFHAKPNISQISSKEKV